MNAMGPMILGHRNPEYVQSLKAYLDEMSTSIGSGIFFSTDRFPDAVQPALAFLPLNPLIHALGTIMLEGTSLWSLGTDVAIITAWGCASFALALRWFRWN